MWTPFTLGKSGTESWNVNKLTFGGMTLNFRDAAGNTLGQSSDLEIGGIIELNAQCMDYLNEYDEVCATYLENVVAKLPITTNNIQYVAFK